MLEARATEAGADITDQIATRSGSVRAITPTWSSDGTNGQTPCNTPGPQTGLNPTTPQRAAGMRTDPPVSVPSAPWARPASRAAADPPDDPPTLRAGSAGWLTFAVRTSKAPGSLIVVPRIMAPDARNCATTGAATGGLR